MRDQSVMASRNNRNEEWDEKRDKAIRLIAEVLEGLQVPALTGKGPLLLGTAFMPYIELVQLLGIDFFEDYISFVSKLMTTIEGR